MSGLEEMFGFGWLVRMILLVGWPGAWLFVHIREALADLSMAASVGVMEGAATVGAAVELPAPWEVGGHAIQVAMAVGKVAYLVVVG